MGEAVNRTPRADRHAAPAAPRCLLGGALIPAACGGSSKQKTSTVTVTTTVSTPATSSAGSTSGSTAGGTTVASGAQNLMATAAIKTQLVPSSSSQPAQIANQDDGAYLIFRRSGSGPWKGCLELGGRRLPPAQLLAPASRRRSSRRTP